MILNTKAAWRNLYDEPEYYANSFTLIGLKDYPTGTRVSPESSLYVGEKRRVSLFAKTADGAFMPYGADVIKIMKKGYLPIVMTDIEVDGSIRYRTEMFAGPLQGAPLDGMVTEEDNYVNYVRLTLDNASNETRTAALSVEVTQHYTPSSVTRKPLRSGLAGEFATASVGEGIVLAVRGDERIAFSCDAAAMTFSCELAPGESASVELRIPYMPVKDSAVLRLKDEYGACLSEVETFWEDFLQQGTLFEIPHVKALNTLKASIVYTFMTRDRGEIHPGEGFYDLFWTRDAAFINYAMQMFNYTKQADENLPFFWERSIDKEGGFVSHEGQLDGTGQGLWGLYQYYMLSRNREWLELKYPDLKRAAEWIMKRRRTDLPKDDPFYGLMPNSLADGECLWDGKSHIVGYDLWSLRGLKCFALLAEQAGRAEDAATYNEAFDEYMGCVLRALDRAGADYFPPSYELQGTHWSNIKMIFPFPIIDKDDPRVGATMDRAEQSFVEGVCAWNGQTELILDLPMKAIHPYMSTYITQTRLIQGDDRKVAEHFYAMLEHTTSTHGFPEGIFYEYRLSWNDTLPHIYGHATYMILLRRMLILEEGATLHLGLGLPPEWLAKGVRVRDALTEFGLMSFEASGDGASLQAKIDLPQRNRPEKVVFYVPEAYQGKRLAVNGEACALSDRRQLILPEKFLGGSVTIEAGE
ncbi:hypothetical protein [Cohnella hongkongensis]|uniref:Uncharacterized protein n=1 Tax=Cohnella hongkongensis TaxID=178337 RepID=A0ABV9F9S3_9BACL